MLDTAHREVSGTTSVGESSSGTLRSVSHRPPTTVVGGRYRLQRPLGRGGMAVVWEATDLLRNQSVAIKLLRDEPATDDPVAVLHEEALSTARAHGPHVVELLASGDDEKVGPYLVLELLRGEDLYTRLERGGRMPRALALDVALQIADALASAHRAGVVHGDLKPGNVFLERVDPSDDRFRVKLIDFGHADRRSGAPSFSPSPTIFGTLAYMAPERLRGRAPDERGDVWSLGVILFELLTGTRPYPIMNDPTELLRFLVREDLPLVSELVASTPRTLCDLVVDMLEVDAELRLPDGLAAKAELEAERASLVRRAS